MPDLVVHPSGGKIGKGAGKRDLAPDGHPGRYPHHVGLRNAHLKKTVGEFFLKGVHFKGPGKVGTQPYHIVVFPSQFK